MSVTGNFFSKLRHLALTLEKETAHLEQVFGQEDDDYEEESPMRVLHDLRSEVMSMKTDIQVTLDKNEKRGQELNGFLKLCKVLQQRNASDIQQIRDTFQNYGYKRLESETQESDAAEDSKLEGAEESSESSDPQGLPPPPAIEKQAAWELLRVPQLSDFGLSHYQLPAMWEPQAFKKAPEEKPKPLYKDIRTITVPKTPKYALRREEDFSQIQHFGISDYSANLNDDYTMALINKKKGSSGPENPKESSKDFKHLLATPAHLTYRNDCVDSPLPPVFCTPGLKVHKKGSFNMKDEKCDAKDTDDATSSSEAMRSDLCQSLRSNSEAVDSPRPPTFCTPGLKVQKKDLSCGHPEPSESKAPPPVVKDLDTPPVPSFETKWLKSDTTRTLDITEPIRRPDFSHNLDLKEAAPPVLQSDKYFEKPVKTSSPPKMRDFCIETPPRPEMTSCLTEDLFKHNLNLASPPKVSQYEHQLWTPNRPEMTTCITDDISQILSRYCENQTKPPWQNASKNKENRP